MPNCIELLNPSGEAEAFNAIDTKMCKHFGVPVDEKKYYRQWYDRVAFDLSLGKTFDDLLKRYDGSDENYDANPDMVAIISWLKANYTPHSWYESSSSK